MIATATSTAAAAATTTTATTTTIIMIKDFLYFINGYGDSVVNENYFNLLQYCYS